MVRWEPGARERLQAAALELYSAQGFDATTVGEIAERAGLTERTFYRYFADSREVLFDGQDVFRRTFVEGVAAAPAAASPLEMMVAALASSADFFPNERRPYSRQRQRVIEANPGLQERELLKLASLATLLAAALRERGVPEPSATLAAESGVTVFRVAFDSWLEADDDRTIADIEQELFLQLGTVTASR
jgi:AcrR family transcriptional regulator